MNDHDTSPAANSWDTYWRGTGDAGAFSSGGVSHPAVQAFWDDLLRSLLGHVKTPRILDIATGNGAVVETALNVFGPENASITCIDVSVAAIENVKRRFPGVTGVVADALSIPLEDESFDIATSQFGVEYAGIDAIYETTRLLAPDGWLVLLAHVEHGSVFKECSDSFKAIARLRESNFVPYALELFKTGFATVRGADREPYDDAGRKLAPAVKAAEAIMQEYGEHVAGDTIARLYDDVGRIHTGLPTYDPDEVMQWLHTMDSELDAYAERMSSMIDAALSQDDFDRVRDTLTTQGLTVERAGAMTPPGQKLPLAWVLIAKKHGQKMTQNPAKGIPDELKPWVRTQLDDVVQGISDLHIFEGAFFEVKPVWSLPLQILVGKARETSDPDSFKWFICGEVPLDCIDAAAATTPREAVRHFAMKWQLDATRLGGDAAKTLVGHAEALYPLTDDDRLWEE